MSKMHRLVLALSLLSAIVLALAGGYYLGGFQDRGGLRDTGTVVGNIEYTVWDSSGILKEHVAIHNTTLDGLLNDTRARLGIDGTTLTNNDLYNNIQAVKTDKSGATPANGDLSGNLDANPGNGTAPPSLKAGTIR